MNEHSFVKPWLKRLNNTILINGINFFEKDLENCKFEISPLKTYLIKGNSFISQEEEERLEQITYTDLKTKYNIGIYSMPAGDRRWRKRQDKIYFMEKLVKKIPGEINPTIVYNKGWLIELDKVNKRIRVRGEGLGHSRGRYLNGDITPWIDYEDKKPGPKKTVQIHYDSYTKAIEEIYDAQIGINKGPTDTIYIRTEIPIMITDEGKLLCMPQNLSNAGTVLPKILIVGKSGKGKCHRKGTTILMADGTRKKIEDIKIGDEVISPQRDGTNTFSKVIDTCKYFSDANYIVREKNRNHRELYHCTSNHIIPIWHNKWVRDPENKKSNKRPKQYASWSIEDYEAEHLAKLKNKSNNNIGFSSFAIEKYKDRINCEIEPYTLGVWLGDGMFQKYSQIVINKKHHNKKQCGRKTTYFKQENHSRLTICCADFEIIEEVSKYYPIMRLYRKQNNKATDYDFSINSNFAVLLNKYRLCNKDSGNKFIPDEAMLSDIEYRKKLMAGLIDTDGSLEYGGYRITTKSKQLAEDILNLTYSIGGRATIRKVKKGIKRIGFVGEYYTVTMFLHNLDIPIKVKRKIKTVESCYLAGNRVAIELDKSEGCEVYGITIDSPSQYYITDNWMVTHNSFILNSMLGRIFYTFQDRVALLNDSLDQFYDLSLPMMGFDDKLAMLGNTPKHLPVINLYMSGPHVKIKYPEENVSYRLVLSFKDFLFRWSFWTHGVDKWKIGPPEKYFTKTLVEAMQSCSDIDSSRQTIFKIITDQMDGKLDDGKKAMIMKWVSTLDSVYRDEFTDNLYKSDKSVAAEWELITRDGEKLKGHPLIIAAEAGTVPIVNNFMVKTKPIAKKHMADLLNKIVMWQMLRGDKKKNWWVFIDELKDFLGRQLSSDELYQALDYIFTQGRYNKIGFVGNVQEYSKLTPSMRANATHLIIFELQTKDERNAVAGDFGLDKDQIEKISKLDKFQSLMVAKDKVVLYDKYGTREVKDGGIWRGYSVPPISIHKAPGMTA